MPTTELSDITSHYFSVTFWNYHYSLFGCQWWYQDRSMYYQYDHQSGSFRVTFVGWRKQNWYMKTGYMNERTKWNERTIWKAQTNDTRNERTIHERTNHWSVAIYYPMTNDPGSIEVQYSIVLLFEWLLCKLMWLTNPIFYTQLIYINDQLVGKVIG